MSSEASLQAASSSFDSAGPESANFEQRRSVSPMLARKIAPASLESLNLSGKSDLPWISTMPSRLESALMSALRATERPQVAIFLLDAIREVLDGHTNNQQGKESSRHFFLLNIIVI